MKNKNSKNSKNSKNTKGLKGHSVSNLIALGMILTRKGGPMKDRRAERGGSKVTIARRIED